MLIAVGCAMSNTFDASTHSYYIDGRKVPSVTQVLNDLIPGFKAGEWYLNRGQAVHACAALIAQGVEFDHDPAIDGQVRAVRRFFTEVKPVVIAVEKQVYSARYQYAGTLDLLADINGKWLVIDFKASVSAALPYQLAAYSIALGPEQLTRYGCGVIINEDGSYKMTKVYDLRLYQQGFLSLLTAYNIRRNAGIKEGEEV
jgi:hypothetical protein